MDLMQLLSILRARIWLILLIFIATVATTTVVSFVLPKQYTAQTDLIVDAKSVDPVSGATLPVQMMSSYLATQIDVITSHTVALKVVDQLKLDTIPSAVEQFHDATDGKGNPRDWLAGVLLKSLAVIPGRNSSVLAITFTGADPEFAALVVNTFAQAYINTTLELLIEPAKNTSRWFDQQLQTARTNLTQAQETLSRYQSENSIVTTNDRLDTENARLNDLVRQMVVAQGQSMTDQSRIEGKRPEDLPEVINNQMVQRIKSEIGQQEAKISELSARLGENNPNYIQAKEELRLLKVRLATEMTTVLDSFRTNAAASRQHEKAMRVAVEQQKFRILALKNQSDSITVLASEVESVQHAYDYALQRFSLSRMQSQVGQTNIVVLNAARPEYTPSAPKIFRSIILSIFLGTLLAIGMALFVEMLNRVVRSPANIVQEFDMPVLGVLSKQKYLTANVNSALPE